MQLLQEEYPELYDNFGHFPVENYYIQLLDDSVLVTTSPCTTYRSNTYNTLTSQELQLSMTQDPCSSPCQRECMELSNCSKYQNVSRGHSWHDLRDIG